MIAEGRLTAGPVLEEVRRLYDSRQTGILALTDAHGEQITVSFREGIIQAASSSKGTHRLTAYLVNEGYLNSRELDEIQLESRRQNMIIGEAIVKKKLLGHVEVGVAARKQSLDLIEHALTCRFNVRSFTNTLCSFHVPAGVSFPHVLLELSRKDRHVFEPAPGMQFVLASNTDISAFSWSPEELCVLGELESPKRFDDLLEATGIQSTDLKRILGILERVAVIKTLSQLTSPAPNENAVVSRGDMALEVLIPSVTNAVLDPKLEVAKNESSFVSEQFRSLKIQLRHAESEIQRKAFTISSPDAHDGKSLISLNLALSFAQDPGCRVIIVDCDLRMPSLDRYLGVAQTPGLLQYLSSSPLRPHCFMRRLDNLYFMTSGGVAPNPIEALSMRRMKQLLDLLRNQFDTIILDSPPYLPIADARVVTALSDGLILVVRSGKTGYASTDRALKVIDQKKLLGIVLNDVKAIPFQTYHNHDYYVYGGRGTVYPSTQKLRTSSKNLLEP
jgi:capsular exopolysaccharide synthesis family protein